MSSVFFPEEYWLSKALVVSHPLVWQLIEKVVEQSEISDRKDMQEFDSPSYAHAEFKCCNTSNPYQQTRIIIYLQVPAAELMFLNPSFLTCPHMSLPASQSSSFIPFLHLFHHTDLNTSSRDPCFCAFWAVLTFADVEALRKSILECEKSTFLLGFCMHACMHRDPVTLGTESTRKALISPSNETTRVDLSRKRKIVDVAHIYPHYLIADRRNNFTITFPPLWKMLEYFGHRTKAKRWHDKIFTNPIDPTR